MGCSGTEGLNPTGPRHERPQWLTRWAVSPKQSSGFHPAGGGHWSVKWVQPCRSEGLAWGADESVDGGSNVDTELYPVSACHVQGALPNVLHIKNSILATTLGRRHHYYLDLTKKGHQSTERLSSVSKATELVSGTLTRIRTAAVRLRVQSGHRRFSAPPRVLQAVKCGAREGDLKASQALLGT